jgi:hypothetical protein
MRVERPSDLKRAYQRVRLSRIVRRRRKSFQRARPPLWHSHSLLAVLFIPPRHPQHFGAWPGGKTLRRFWVPTRRSCVRGFCLFFDLHGPCRRDSGDCREPAPSVQKCTALCAAYFYALIRLYGADLSTAIADVTRHTTAKPKDAKPAELSHHATTNSPF